MTHTAENVPSFTFNEAYFRDLDGPPPHGGGINFFSIYHDSVHLAFPHLLLLPEDSNRAESFPLPFELPTDSLPWESLPCDSFPGDSVPLPLEPLPPISTSSCNGGRGRFLSSCGEPGEAGCSWLMSLPSEASPNSVSSSTPSRPPQSWL